MRQPNWCPKRNKAGLLVSTSRTMSSSVESFFRLLQASSGITSLLHTSQVFFRHRKNKTASGDRKSRQGRDKKMTSKKSRGRGKVEWYVQDELYEVFGQGKKSPKKESNKSQHQKKQPLQKSRTISKVQTLTE